MNNTEFKLYCAKSQNEFIDILFNKPEKFYNVRIYSFDADNITPDISNKN